MQNLENVQTVGEDFRWDWKMEIGNCSEMSENGQCIHLMASVVLNEGGCGSVSMIRDCKLCAWGNSIEILSSTAKSYNTEDNGKLNTVVEFECWELEPIDFQPQVGFGAEGMESSVIGIFRKRTGQTMRKGCRSLWDLPGHPPGCEVLNCLLANLLIGTGKRQSAPSSSSRGRSTHGSFSSLISQGPHSLHDEVCHSSKTHQ